MMRCRVQLQTNEAFRGKGMFSVLSSIVAKDGPLGLYKGVQSPLIGMFAMNSVLFSAYGFSRRLIGESPTRELNPWELFQAGVIAGTAVAAVEGGRRSSNRCVVFCCSLILSRQGPVDFFKCQLQMRSQEYKSFFHCATSIIKQRGILGAYQGIGPTLIRNSIGET
jgi:solute carrier family 25 carnitine/acylcarnitine transporter 20/29